MHLFQDVLHGYLDVFVVVFIDDILVYSRNSEEHAEQLRLIFERLRKYQLFANASKCTLHINEVEFVGQWITQEGAAPIAEKLCVVCDWEPPTNAKDARSFLGFANYYLCKAPLLIFPNPKLPYTVVTDASAKAVGGVLM